VAEFWNPAGRRRLVKEDGVLVSAGETPVDDDILFSSHRRGPKVTVAVDASVAVPLLVRSHQHHADVVQWWDGQELALSGPALAETYSVLTRLPGVPGWQQKMQRACSTRGSRRPWC
jgi:hypothetical protein